MERGVPAATASVDGRELSDRYVAACPTAGRRVASWLPAPVTSTYSARSGVDVFDEGLMAWWTAKHRRFDFRVTYTGEPPEGARFTGRIPEMLDQVSSDLSGHAVYIAGSPEFVDACIRAARSLGAVGERIFVEKYHPQSPAEVPPAEQLA